MRRGLLVRDSRGVQSTRGLYASLLPQWKALGQLRPGIGSIDPWNTTAPPAKEDASSNAVRLTNTRRRLAGRTDHVERNAPILPPPAFLLGLPTSPPWPRERGQSL